MVFVLKINYFSDQVPPLKVHADLAAVACVFDKSV